jgi:hypothetical protein
MGMASVAGVENCGVFGVCRERESLTRDFLDWICQTSGYRREKEWNSRGSLDLI